jgi:predicted PurR-regulated permease PerM
MILLLLLFQETWVVVVKELGFPIAICIILLYFLLQIWFFIRKLIENQQHLIETQIKFNTEMLKDLKQVLNNNTEAVRVQTESVKSHIDSLQALEKMFDATLRLSIKNL